MRVAPVLGAMLAVVTPVALTSARAGDQVRTSPVVGVPGCSDDVPVRASREMIHFESRGRSVRAHLYSPRGEPNGRGIVMLHGGTGFEMNAILFDAHAIQLASRGYWVMLPAYFDAAQRDPSRSLVVSRAWRQAAVDAALVLETKPGVQPGEVAFWGYSLGGRLAVGAAGEAASPVRDIIASAAGGEPGRDLLFEGRRALLLHARRDDVVPPRATQGLAAAIEKRGARIEVVELDFDGHQYDLDTWCSVMRSTREFLEHS